MNIDRRFRHNTRPPRANTSVDKPAGTLRDASWTGTRSHLQSSSPAVPYSSHSLTTGEATIRLYGSYRLALVVGWRWAAGITTSSGSLSKTGIPLHNIGMCLEYSSEDGFGWGTFPMKTKEGKVIREGHFAKGAITEFAFATDQIDDNYDDFIRFLKDLKSQRAQLTLHADQYSMWYLRLHDRLWWLKRGWNGFAFWITRRLEREVTTSLGTKGSKYLFRIPVFESPGQNMLHFAAVVRESPPRI